MKKEFNSRGAGTQTPEGITIFVDLDGVLADFEAHLHACGKVKEDGSPQWDALDHEWWAGIPVFHGAKKFYHDLKELGLVKFLSAPVPGVDSFSGKAHWIANAFLPQRGRFALLDLILCSGKDKQYLAGPSRVLVDDRIKNINEWVAAGGIGVHHKGDFAQTLQAVREAVAGIRQKASAPAAPAPGI